MRINVTLLLLLLTFFSTLHAQGPNLNWVGTVASTSDVAGRDVLVDQQSNTYTMGQFQGTADMDPGPGTFFLTSAGDEDIFLQKVDFNGDLAWAIAIGGTGLDDGTGLAQDFLGNLYLTGGFEGVVDFDPGTGVQNVTAMADSDIFLLKIDPLGNLEWVLTWPGGMNEYAEDVALDPWGNILLTGNFEGVLDFDPGPGATQVGSAGGYDMFVMKLDPAGNLLWAGTFAGDGTSVEEGYEIKSDQWGNIYSTGGFLDSVDFDPGLGVTHLRSRGGNDIFLHKMDSAGNLLWVRTYGGIDEDYAYDLGLDNDGRCMFVGGFTDSANFDTTGAYLQGAGQADGFVALVDSNGVLEWVHQAGGPGDDVVKVVENDFTCCYVHVGGEFSGGGVVQYGGAPTGLVNNGDIDVFLMAVHSQDGRRITQVGFGGPGEESLDGMTIEHIALITITGAFEDSVDFDPGASQMFLHSQGGFDGYTHSLDIILASPEPSVAGLVAFPNPSSGAVAVDLREFGDTGSWQLLDLQGRILGMGEFTAGRFQVDLRSRNAGLYFLRAKSGAREASVKVLRQ